MNIKYLPILLLLLSSVFICSVLSAQENEEKETKVHYLNIGANSRTASVYVNGILVARDVSDSITQLLTDFLVDGKNEIKLVSKRQEEGFFGLSVGINEMVREGGEYEQNELLKFETKDDPIGKTFEKTLTVDISIKQEWMWTKGELIGELSIEDKKEIRTIIKKLHDYFAHKDIDKVMHMLEHLNIEIAQVIGMEPKEWLGDIRKTYTKGFESDSWKMTPLKLDSLAFHSSEKVVSVTAPGPILQSGEMPEGGRMTMTYLYFSKIKGAWHLVKSR